MEWVATGRVFSAQEALAGRLVSRVLPPEELLPAAHALAREIADNTSAVSVALARQMLWRMLGADHPMEAHRIDSKAIYAMGRSPDAYEGVQSFLEKRAPQLHDEGFVGHAGVLSVVEGAEVFAAGVAGARLGGGAGAGRDPAANGRTPFAFRRGSFIAALLVRRRRGRDRPPGGLRLRIPSPRRAARVSGGCCSGNCGRASVISNQGAFESTKMWLSGLTPGSVSRAPIGITTKPRLVSTLGIGEPQVVQKVWVKNFAPGTL